MDRVTGLEYRDAASNLVQALEYDYNAAGMITQKVSRTASATNGVVYAYDELDRLIREDDGATAREYDFDLAGNRLAMLVIAGGATNTTAYTLGTANRLASWTGGGACAYDVAGCVTNLIRSGKPAVALEWDGQYRVTAAYTNGVLAESYGYDTLGRRATVTSGGVATHFVNEGPHVIAETDAAGNLLRRYAYGPGVDDILTMTDFGGGVTNAYYYIKDLQNTVLAIRNASGELVETYDYDAWGNVLAVRDGSGNPLTQSAIGNRYLFQGREYSWTTGLYNFRARWYDPETGRWLSNDPIGISGGLNQYVFCANSPIMFMDASGLAVTLNLVDPRDPEYGKGDKLNPPPGAFSILVHGGAYKGFESRGPDFPATEGGKPNTWSPTQMANVLKRAGLQPGQDVILYSCWGAWGGAGSNAAKLYEALQIAFSGKYKGHIWAPTGRLFIDGIDGACHVTDELDRSTGCPLIVNGEWKCFPPKCPE